MKLYLIKILKYVHIVRIHPNGTEGVRINQASKQQPYIYIHSRNKYARQYNIHDFHI